MMILLRAYGEKLIKSWRVFGLVYGEKLFVLVVCIMIFLVVP